ncbi:MAG: hypothetical protein P8M53_07540 [Pirellulales bacterium]|jgi:hypothetical protein|nr:hypothetical protein [Pirellulales bacterium]MDO7714664.1 hypothetical protein [Pirellulales bacterium]OUT70934.1 MAG: hypothetical protein CBB70_00820 [Planctomycetaceae bacterium TMED10]|tara:strand:- start:891 stop:1151 length:261 start_codon:yes stop_codon:yes gene_type:complete
MKERSSYQQKIIKNYYKNRSALSHQRLSELVTDLYLAEGKKRATIWKRIRSALENLEVKPERIEHLEQKDSPELVAKLVEELMGSG